MHEGEKQNQEASRALATTTSQVKELELRNKELVSKLEQGEQQLQSKVQVIEWLNKELNAAKYEPVATAAKQYGMVSMLPASDESFRNGINSSDNRSPIDRPPSTSFSPVSNFLPSYKPVVSSSFQQADDLSSLAQPFLETSLSFKPHLPASRTTSTHPSNSKPVVPESLPQATIDTLAKYIGWFDTPSSPPSETHSPSKMSDTSTVAPPAASPSPAPASGYFPSNASNSKGKRQSRNNRSTTSRLTFADD